MKTLISTLAIALAFSFITAAPAEAALTQGRKCAPKANLLTGIFTLSSNKAEANVSRARADTTRAADLIRGAKFP